MIHKVKEKLFSTYHTTNRLHSVIVFNFIGTGVLALAVLCENGVKCLI